MVPAVKAHDPAKKILEALDMMYGLCKRCLEGRGHSDRLTVYFASEDDDRHRLDRDFDQDYPIDRC